jgi:RNA polymerase sigma-70 factor (ECF subfamily)
MGRHAANRPAPETGGAPVQRAPLHADLFAPNPGTAAARAAEQRNTALFESLVAPHRAALRAYVLRLTGGDEAGTDSVVKETLYRAAQDPTRYPQTESAVRPWLVLTARMVLREPERPAAEPERPAPETARRAPETEWPNPEPEWPDPRPARRSATEPGRSTTEPHRSTIEPHRSTTETRRSTTVLRALDDLSDVHRDILVELFYRGISLEDAADEHGVPVETVKSRLYYAMRALRVVLDQQIGGLGPDLSVAP